MFNVPNHSMGKLLFSTNSKLLKFSFIVVLVIFISSAAHSQNYSLEFNGTSDYVNIPSSTTTQNLSSYTFTAWINGSSLSTNYNPIFFKQSGSAADIEIYGGNGGVTYAHNRSNGGSFQFHYGNALPINQWVHFAVTYTAGGNLQTYINGVLDETVAFVTPLTNTYPLNLGRVTTFTTDYLNGNMDEVSVWSRVLSAAEISAMFSDGGLPADQTSLVAYYDFDDGTGTTLTDSSPNGNDGSLIGAQWSTNAPLPGNFIVSNLNDSGVGSLRQAILDANAGNGATASNPHIIDINVSGQITLIDALPGLANHITINGHASGTTISRDGGQEDFRIFQTGAHTIVLHNLILDNARMNSTDNDGGAILATATDLTLDNCVIQNATANRFGGGLYATSGSNVQLNKVTIYNNQVTSTGGWGAGIGVLGGSLTITNCTIHGNISAGNGGAVFVWQGTNFTMTNTTVVNNSTGNNGGGIVDQTSATSYSFTNNIIANNTATNLGDDIFIVGASFSVNQNNLVENCAGTGCPIFSLSSDPQLNALATCGIQSYYPLNTGSPAFNAGTTTGAPTEDICGTAWPTPATPNLGSSSEQLDPNYALDFSGDVDGSEKYVAVGNIGAVTDWTIETWFKVDPVNYQNLFHTNMNGATNSNNGVRLEASSNWTDGNLYFFVEGTGYTVFPLSSGLTSADWHHVAIVGDQTNNELRVYLDGVELTYPEYPTPPASWPSAFTDLQLGRGFNTATADRDHNGQLDDFRIWSTARSATQIQNFKDQELTGGEPGLLLYYNFSDGPGSSTVTDKTINGFNGTLNNFNVSADWVAANHAVSTTEDTGQPAPVITSTESGTTSVSPIPVTITFDEVVTNFVLSDLTVVRGTASNLATTDNVTWTVDVTPSSSGTVTVGLAANTVTDLAGNDNIAATQFSVDYTFPNYALDFDGTDDYIVIPLSGDGLSEVTIEMWFYRSGSGQKTLFNWSSTPGTGTPWIYIRDDGSTITHYLNGLYQTATSSISSNAWHHYALVFNGSNWVSYIDGIQEATYGVPIGTFDRSNIYIANGFAGTWQGQIDEVRIWNTSRTATQIQNFKDQELTGGEPGLVAYYDFADGPGSSTLANRTLNSSNGTLTNMDPASDWVAASHGVSFTEDTNAPIPVITSIESGTTAISPIPVTITFDEVVTNFDVSDLAIGGGTASDLATTDNVTWTVDISPSSIGAVTVDLAANTVTDLAGNDNIAAAQFSIDYTLPNYALDFDGANDHVNLSDLNNKIENISAFTIETWVYLDSHASNEGIFSKFDAAGASIDLLLGNAAGRVFFRVGNGENSLVQTVGGPLTLSTWHHLAVVFDGSQTNANDRVKIYVGGVEQSLSYTGTLPTSTAAITADAYIGRYFNSANNYYLDGQLDELRLWNTARTATQIQNYKDQELTGGEPGLVAYYDFSDGPGSGTLTDQSINGLNGTLTSMDPASDWVAASHGVSFTEDTNAPIPVISSSESGTTAVSPIPITISFDEVVTNFVVNDLAVSGGTASNLATTDNVTWTADITPFTGTTVTVDLPASTVTDLAANDNVASNQFSIDFTVADYTLDFDGTGDFVDITATSTGLPQGSAPMTVEAWVKTSQTSIGNIVSWGTRTNGQRMGFAVRDASLAYIGQFNDRTSPNADINDNVWHHVAMTYAGGTNGTMNFYVDGVLDFTTTITLGTAGQNLKIANISEPDNGEYFNGEIDNIRIWDVERSATDIFANMTTQILTAPGLVAAYDFNATSGTALTDITGNGNNGTLAGDPVWTPSTAPGCFPNGKFIGTSDSDWNNTSNWCGGVVPPVSNVTEDIIISEDAAITETQDLVLDNNNFIVQSGARLDVDLSTNGVNLQNGATFTNEGTVFFASGTQINDPNGDFINNGLITGFGTFNNNFINQAPGTVAPGASPGCTDFVADFTNIGTLIIDVNGTTPCTGHDQLTVGGTAFLGGTLDVILGYTPTNGDEIVIIDASTISGTFATVNLPSADWSIQYDSPNAGQVSIKYLDSTTPFISSTESGTTNLSPIPISIEFASAVLDFEISDITVSNGVAADLNTSDNANYSVLIYPINNGSVTVELAAGVVGGYLASNQFSINATLPQNALDFDGVNDFVDISGVNKLTHSPSPQDYTIELWFNADDITTVDITHLISYSSSIDNDEPILGLRFVGGSLQFFRRNTVVNESLTLQGPAINIGEWYHVAVTKLGNDFALYINGELVDTGTTTSTGTFDRTRVLIGAYSGADTGKKQVKLFFDGKIDEVKLWNDARSNSEIISDMYEGYPSVSDNLEAYYPFSHSSGEVLGDAGPNNYSGRLFGEFGVVASATNNTVTAEANATDGSALSGLAIDEAVGSVLRFLDEDTPQDRIITTHTATVFTVDQDWTVNPVNPEPFAISYNNPVWVSSSVPKGPAPSVFNATQVTVNSVLVDYLASSQATDILVDVSSDPTFTTDLRATDVSVGTTGSATVTVTPDLTPGTQYYYRAKALYPGGAESDYVVSNAFMITPGNALELDGIDDAVFIGDILTTSYTKEAWIKIPNANGLSNNILSGSNFGEHAFWVNQTNNYRLSSGHNGLWETVIDPNPIPFGVWQHVAVSYDAITDEMTLYRNGEIVDQATAVAGFNSGNALGLGIYNGSNFYGGKMDEVRVWSDVRTQQEIQEQLYATLNGQEDNLLVYYRMDETTGSSFVDLSPKGNDAQVVSGFDGDEWTVSGALAPLQYQISEASDQGFRVNWQRTFSAGSIYVDVNDASDFAGTMVVDNVLVGSGQDTTGTVTASINANQEYFARIYIQDGDYQSPYSETISFYSGPGNALDFDGMNDKVVTTYTLNNSGDYTLEAWFKDEAGVAGNKVILSGGDTWWLGTLTTSGVLRFTVAAGQEIDGSVNVRDDAWHHVAVTKVGTTYSLYLDGILEAGPAVLTPVGNNPIQIGSIQTTTFEWTGELDEIRIWETERSLAEIQETQFSTLSGIENGLAAYYRFDEGDAGSTNTGVTILTDLSGNNDGNLQGPFALTGTTSNWITSAALTSSNIPTAPDSLIVYRTSATELTFEWQDQSNDETKFIVEAATDEAFTVPVKLDSTSANTTTITIDVGADISQYYRVVAANANGSAPSPVEFGTTELYPGYAMTFVNGTDRVNVANPSQFNGNTITAEAWIKTSKASGLGRVVVQGDGTNQRWSLGINWPGFEGKAVAVMVGSTTNAIVTGTSDVNDGLWHHVAGTYNLSTGETKIYVDGQLENTDFAVGTPHGGTFTVIGNTGGGIDNQELDGEIDELRIWDIVKTDFSDRFTPIDGNETNLISYYSFDENNAGGTVYDRSLNQNNGTPVNSQPYTLSGAIAPSGLVTTDISNNQIDLTWQDNIDNETGFVIERSATADFAIVDQTFNVGANVTTYTDVTGFTVDEDYYYRVRAELPGAVASGYTPVEAATTRLLPGNELLFFDNPDIVHGSFSNTDLLNGDFTIELWFDPEDNLSGSFDIIRLFNSSTGDVLKLTWDGEFGYVQGILDGSTFESVITPSVFTFESRHIALTRNGTSLTIYRDGSPEDTGSSGLNIEIDSLEIGNVYFGTVDEVRIWKTARSSIEIANTYKKELQGTETGLLAYYQFDEESGTDVWDRSGNSFNLVNSGADIVLSGAMSGDTPQAVTDVVAYKLSDTQIQIEWTDISGEAGYRILAADDFGFFANARQVGEVGADVTSFVHNVGVDESNFYQVLSYSGPNVVPSDTTFATTRDYPYTALEFDGVTDYFSASVDPTIQFAPADPFTISFWIKTTNPVLQTILSNNFNVGYKVSTQNGNIIWEFGTGADVIEIQSNTTNIADGDWHHVAISYDGSEAAAGVSFFIDGLSQSTLLSTDQLAATLSYGTDPLTIGAQDGAILPFTGTLDEIKIYNFEKTVFLKLSF